MGEPARFGKIRSYSQEDASGLSHDSLMDDAEVARMKRSMKDDAIPRASTDVSDQILNPQANGARKQVG